MAPLKNVRRLTIGGGLLIGVAIVASLLSGLFSGFGGQGSGNGPTVVVLNGGNSMNIPDTAQSKPVDQHPEPKEEPASPPESADADVVNLLIDGRSYFIRQSVDGKRAYRPIELPELVNLAKAARGNEDGIRVRVSRRESSRASAENLLQEKLMEAGLRKEAIYLQEGFVPESQHPKD